MPRLTSTFYLLVALACFVDIFNLLAPPLARAQIAIPPESAWTDYGLIIDAAPFGQGWDALFEGITPGALVKKNNLYYLYYTGADNYIAQLNNIGPAHRSIGVATSPDGTHWTKYSGNPVLTFTSTGNPEEGSVSVGVYVDTSGTFHAYYGTNISLSSTSADVHANTRYATSADGLNFTDQGIVLAYNNTSLWGYGDEIHGVGAWNQNNTWYAFYIPNGVSVSRKLGIAWGNSPTNLTQTSGVLSSGVTIDSGPISIIPLSSTQLAYFTTKGGVTTVRTAATSNLASVSAPVQTYILPGFGKAFYLDQARQTWFMAYDKWSYIGLRLAPLGNPDSTPPTAPPNLSADSPTPQVVQLSWQPSTDPDTGVIEYRIYRNSTHIGTTKNHQFSDTATLAENTGYTYQVRPVNFHGTEGIGSQINVTTPADTTPPAIKSLTRGTSPNQLILTFTEPVDVTSAQTLDHYSATGGLTFSGASVSTDGTTVTLSTSTQIGYQLYSVTAAGVRDRSSADNSSQSSGVFTADPNSGLVGYWRLDQSSSGTGEDTSGFAHHGDLKGTTAWNTGKFDTALSLDGTSTYLEIESAAVLNQTFSGNYTVTGWAKPSGIPPNTTAINVAYALISVPNFRLQYTAGQTYIAELKTTAGNFSLASPVIGPGNWHYLTAVVDASGRRLYLYLNGDPVPGSPKSFTGDLILLPNQNPGVMQAYYNRYRLGVHDPLFNYENNYFKGNLDDFRVYNRILTASQIGLLPNITPPPTASPPNPADLNGDSLIDFIDFQALIGVFNTIPSFNLIGTGLIDIFDFNYLLNQY